MKVIAINGSPRKKCNTTQMLEACINGVKEANPDTEIKIINVYGYNFTGCKSCFACQMTKNRENLACYIKDEIHDLLDEVRHADGIIIGSPVYFLDISAQAKCFLERLNYPGPSSKPVPSTFIYTMNAGQEQLEQYHIDDILATTRFFMENNFGSKPDKVYSFNTFQYNDCENLNAHFRRNVEAKRAHHDEQFPIDLENAKEAGKKLADRIEKVEVEK